VLDAEAGCAGGLHHGELMEVVAEAVRRGAVEPAQKAGSATVWMPLMVIRM
jgi:hypothetical protein